MKRFLPCTGLKVWLVLSAMFVVSRSGESQAQVKDKSCPATCGDIQIPYPFGIGENCSLSKGFSLNCSHSNSKEPQLFTGGVELESINMEPSQVQALASMSYKCFNASGPTGNSSKRAHQKPVCSNDHKGAIQSADCINDPKGTTTSLYPNSDDKSDPTGNSSKRGIDLQSGPYRFSYEENVFIGVGCDTLAYIYDSERTNYIGGCMTLCSSKNNIVNGSCSGTGCCQTSIQQGIRNYSLDFDTLSNHSSVLNFNPCSYGFIVKKNYYNFTTSDLEYMDPNQTFPLILDWAIGSSTCEEAQRNKTGYACVDENSNCSNSVTGSGYVCKCSAGYRGNPYLQNGCQDIDECQEGVIKCKGDCVNTNGSYTCTCPPGTTGNATGDVCTPKGNAFSTGAKLGVVGLFGGIFFLLAIIGAFLVFKRVKQHKKVIQRKRYFLENHGLLLQHLLSSCDDSTANTKIFTLKEIIKATNNFDDARIVGRGGHGIVYKGILSDLRVVAIKKSKVVVKSEIEEFINEVAILSQMNHRNIVKLFGCCLESEVPLLVYEFISNGTLSDRFHVWDREFNLSWEERLRIASEVAGAVAYLHFSTSKSIFHRDLKSSNILLDDKLTAKVSDFGASKFVMADQSHVTTVVQGTFGYLDPEYFHTGRLTDKSDVYSFGVILVELLTGEKPNSISGSREGRNLTVHFLWMLNEKKLFQVIEHSLVNEAATPELEVVSELAESCLRLRGEERPTMKDVEFILSGLRKTKRKEDRDDDKHYMIN